MGTDKMCWWPYRSNLVKFSLLIIIVAVSFSPFLNAEASAGGGKPAADTDVTSSLLEEVRGLRESVEAFAKSSVLAKLVSEKEELLSELRDQFHKVQDERVDNTSTISNNSVKLEAFNTSGGLIPEAQKKITDEMREQNRTLSARNILLKAREEELSAEISRVENDLKDYDKKLKSQAGSYSSSTTATPNSESN